MVVQARADLLYAVIGHLLTFDELTSLVNSASGWQPGKGSGPRISSSFQDGWKMPTRAIWLKKSAGPAGDYEAGLQTTRIDVRCYGATGKEADDLWAMLDAILVPATGERMVSFTRNGCHVVNIRPEAGEMSDRERDTRYP
jgi:hypothetical protein